jgi:hypothetical protein
MTLMLALFLQGEISVHRTPGKPMMFHERGKPAEEIAARQDGERYWIFVRVNVSRPNVEKYTEEKAELTKEDWESIVKIVDENKLADWKPMNQAKASDWGEAGISIYGKNVQRWTGPIDNPPDKLFQRLAELAKKKIEKLPLYYLKA